MKKIIICIFLLLVSNAIAADPGTIVLTPTIDSEVLDEVSITILPNGKGKIEHFGVKVKEGESGGYEILTSPETNEYKAIKKEIPMEIKQKIENQLKINSLESPYVIIRSVVGYLQTEDKIDLKLCSTFLNLKWIPQNLIAEYSATWTWDAFPSELGTHWYTKRKKDYGTASDNLYAYGHGGAWHQNKDFMVTKLRTIVYHDVYVRGYFYAEYPSTATAYIDGHSSITGEGWPLLHTSVYYYWGSQPIY